MNFNPMETIRRGVDPEERDSESLRAAALILSGMSLFIIALICYVRWQPPQDNETWRVILLLLTIAIGSVITTKEKK